MFTDIVGYTALGQRNEPLSLALVEEQRRLVRPILAKHSGREVKTIGDAFLVDFSSALNAVRCAYDIQRVIREFNISQDVDKRINLRIGIHLGDVVTALDGDISGDAVNVASRIEPLAEIGGVCISRQVHDHVQNKIELRFASLGTKSLKNVIAPLEVFKMLMPWEPQEVSPHSLAKNRIAVLPFANMSADPNDEYFSDGLTEEMISTISRIKDLKVIARTSAMGYKGSYKKVSEIAAELTAGSILEGSVRKVGGRLRITVQLIDSKTADYIWSQTYDRGFEDIFAIQSDIAQNVAHALRTQLLSDFAPQLRKNGSSETTEAYNHYLKGKYFWNQRELDGFNRAIKEFEDALRLDPAFAQAYAGLADTYLLLGRNGHVAPKFAYPKAIETAQKSIALDARLPDPHVTLAAIRQEYEWKWEEAEKEFKDAIELNPSNPIAHSWYALCLGHTGRIDDGIREARLAQELDPLSPRAHCAASEEYLFARDYDGAIESAEKALEISPSFGGAFGYRAYAYVEKGMYDKAIADFQEAGKHFGARAVMGRLGHVLALSGKRDEANHILKQLQDESSKKIPPKSPFIAPPPDTGLDIGLVYIGLGDKEKAIEWLGRATEERTAEVIHFKCEPIYDSLQAEQGFQSLIRKVGLA